MSIAVMQEEAINELLANLPEEIHIFNSSEYSLPVKAAIFGDPPLNTAELRRILAERRAGELKNILNPALVAAEQIEAARADKDDYFLSDSAVRHHVFMGSKWFAGWALLLGGRGQDEIIPRLKDGEFQIFTDQPEVSGTVFIGSRNTAPIYFLQLMVRYGLIWGRIKPGDDHEMGHYLERDLPGFLMITEDLPPLKYLLALGLMKMGAPAVVPPSFPFPYGRTVRAEGAGEMVQAGRSFPNLRARYYQDELITLPDFCNPAHESEIIEPAKKLGGELSTLCLKSSSGIEPGVEVTGEEAGGGAAILVEVEHEDLTLDLTRILERTALKAVNYLSGIKAGETGGRLTLTSGGEDFDFQKIGQAIRQGLRYNYPRLQKIRVLIRLDPDEVKKMAADALEYKRHRRKFITAMTEENSEDFAVCIECRPFSLEHTCISTPGREPMCASRTYESVRAAALFGSSTIGSSIVTWQRPTESDLPLRRAFKKGRVLDQARGEYEGVNNIYQEMTRGHLKRVYLHSLRDFPHTSCGCFQYLAFWLEEVGGIGLMTRNSPALTPDGRTWDNLANLAGGKQVDGITGVSLSYIRSRDFLRGDGGLANVVWVDSALYPKLLERFRPGQRVATEKGVGTMAELRSFLRR